VVSLVKSPPQCREGIGLLTCLSLVTATMVGTGVYTSLGFQLVDLQGGFSILLLWGLGGLIALCGALSYAELAVEIPQSGGEYTYLSELYHPALGFMAAFVSVMAGFTAPIALSSMAFGSYLHAALPMCPAKAASFFSVIIISLGHLHTLRFSGWVQNVMTSLKFLLIGIFLAVGLWSAARHPSEIAMFAPSANSLSELFRPASGVALIFVLYAYSGWNAASYLSGEVRDRRRTVGRSLVLGTLIVTLLYVALNAIFLTAAPARELRGVLNVGSVAATHLLGAMGGRVMSGMIGLGLLASISAMIWAGPRVTQRVGEDYAAFAWLGKRSYQGIPTQATILQLVLVLLLLATGSFESVMLYAQVPLLLCLVFGVAGVFVLRKRSHQNGRTDGFRCPLFPATPLLFIFCTLAALLYSSITHPWESLAGLGTMILPLLVYPWVASQGKR